MLAHVRVVSWFSLEGAAARIERGACLAQAPTACSTRRDLAPSCLLGCVQMREGVPPQRGVASFDHVTRCSWAKWTRVLPPFSRASDAVQSRTLARSEGNTLLKGDAMRPWEGAKTGSGVVSIHAIDKFQSWGHTHKRHTV